jgi:hypothetical protein
VPSKTSTTKSNGAYRGSGAYTANGTRRVNGVVVKSKLPPDALRVGRSRSGLGLFAQVPIRKGAFIIEYWGRRLPADIADEIGTKYMFELNERWTIDGSDRRNIARYINHSCRPNAEARTVMGTIRIYAQKNIKPGDEIAYNYGRRYFKIFLEPIGCKCAACLAKPKRGSRKTNKSNARRRAAPSSAPSAA